MKLWRSYAALAAAIVSSFSTLSSLPTSFGQSTEVTSPSPQEGRAKRGEETRDSSESEANKQIDAPELPLETLWLPASTIAYVHIHPISGVLDHPLRQWFQSSEPFQKFWKGPEGQQARGGIAIFELAAGRKTETLVREVTEHGIHVAIDSASQGIVVLAQMPSEEWIDDYLDKVIGFAQNDARAKKQPDPIKEAEYRGVQGYEYQKVIIAKLDSWLLVTNKSELAKSVIDRRLDKTADSLADAPQFVAAWNKPLDTSDIPVARVYANLDAMREAGIAKDLLGNKPKDFGAELILGGVLAVLHRTPFAVGQLDLDASGLNLSVATPSDNTWFGDAREFYVGPGATGHAKPLLQADNAMLSLSTYRNVSELWLRAGELFDQNVNDQLAQADNTLTTLFSGKDFGTDILGAIEPELRLMVTPQKFAEDATPSIKLPTFALVGKLKKPGAMQRELKRIFQSFIGFVNITSSMSGNPQLDLSSETVGDMQVHWAQYVRDEDRKYENGLPIQFNFSPAVAFRGETVVVASTLQLAKQIASNSDNSDAIPTRSVSEGSPPAATSTSAPTANTMLHVDFRMLQQLLDANRNQMISNNMLEKGHSRVEAEKEIDTLLRLLHLLKSADASLHFDSAAKVTIRVEVEKE